MKFAEIKAGETITVAGDEFIVLEKFENSVLCLTKDFVYENTQFDVDSNNYAESDIRKKLNTDYLSKLADSVDEENILEAEIDLTSDDGLDDYGKVKDKIGLLTADMYRKYNRIIEKYLVNDWWWLVTPWSTPHRGWKYAVRCVSAVGTLHSYCCIRNCGVRPFCIFSSSIFES